MAAARRRAAAQAGRAWPVPDPAARRQRAAVEAAPVPGKINLLLAAESVGALAAVEMHVAGLPWDAAEHERILSQVLGARPVACVPNDTSIRELASAHGVSARIEPHESQPGLPPTVHADGPDEALRAFIRAAHSTLQLACTSAARRE